MVLSDREIKNVLRLYEVVKNVVFVAGVAVMVAGVVAVIAGAYNIGRRDGVQVVPAVANSDTTKAQREKPAAPRPVRQRHIAPPEPVIEETEAEPEKQAARVTARPVPAPVPVVPAPVPVVPAPAPVVGSSVVVAAPEEKHFIAHHKGRDGCDGDLVLTDASLRFDCPSRPDQALNFSRDAVRADDDGIKDLSTGHPYHFKISTMDKPQVCALFNAWAGQGLSAVR